MERSLTFKAGPNLLEGRLNRQSPERAAIITHPHPLYGGDMDNAVVMVLADAYHKEGWTTLRFNFRGTGASQGQFEDGIGERIDLQGAIDYLKALGFSRIDLAGYSFGSWVLAGWSRANPQHDHRMLFVAPPVAFIDFDRRTPIPGLAHVFTGNLDDLAPPVQIASALPHWQPTARLEVIAGADHSFWGCFQNLQQAVATAIEAVTPVNTV